MIYAGAHQPLVDPETWQKVHDLLDANNNAKVYQRRNLHYLRGSLYCGDCDSRLLVSYTKNRWGTTYIYLTCSGRKRKATTCQRQAMSAPAIEELLEDEYRTIALEPEFRDKLEADITDDFDQLHIATQTTNRQLERKRIEQLAKRQKLLDAHYAGAVPLDQLKTEQDKIASQLGRIEKQLATSNADHDRAKTMLAKTLDLAKDCHAAYLAAPDDVRRLFNQAFFTKI